MSTHQKRGIGNVIAPPRFLFFLAVTAVTAWFAIPQFSWRFGTMIAFDLGAAAFLLACLPMLRHESDDMRQSARHNDANRVMLLLISTAVSLAVLAAIASELMQGKAPHLATLILIIGTLVLSWIFSNWIYSVHYAHLFYSSDPKTGGDKGGLEFPETPEPDYWDFIYFGFCLGMTFQTSDVSVTSGGIRKVVTLHCLAAFVFNLGVIAFTINVLGGSSS
ncbi:MAG: DUF1345 domain-containing protein [Sphingomonas sp.]